MIPVRTTLAQLATGLRVGEDACTTCDTCDGRLQSGAPVIVRLHQPQQRRHWSVEALFCENCGVTAPLEARGRAIISARLGVTSDASTQTRWACLVDPKPQLALLRSDDESDR